MAVQLHTYFADSDGHPIDPYTAVAFDKPISLRKATIITAAGGARVELYDGTADTDPLLFAAEFSGLATANPKWSEDDLPFKTACYVKIASGAAEVFLYSK